MSPLPENMRNRWHSRPEPKPGHGTVYWHVLFQDQPQVTELATDAQRRLAGFQGLHMTPIQWLHMTVSVVGSTDDITSEEMKWLLEEASQALAGTEPVRIRLGHVLYHPEAITVAAEPKFVLRPVHDAIQTATRKVLEFGGVDEHPWTPHITLCYSTSDQPATPLITALGRELPVTEATVSAVNLVIQDGPERSWNWHPFGKVRLGTAVTSASPSAL